MDDFQLKLDFFRDLIELIYTASTLPSDFGSAHIHTFLWYARNEINDIFKEFDDLFTEALK